MSEEEKEREKRISDSIDLGEKYLDRCEIVSNRNPYDIDPYEFYDIIDKLDPFEIRDKTHECKWAIDSYNQARRAAADRVYFTPKRCLLVKKETNNFTREFIDEYEDYLKSMEKIGLDHFAISYSPDELYMNCKRVLELEDYWNNSVCPIANDNALVLHYIANERIGDVDRITGLAVRAIEKECIGFPMVQNLFYINPKTQKRIGIRVIVNENADSSGRVGRIDIFQPAEDIDLAQTSTAVIYNRLPEIFRRRILNKILDISYGTGFRHPKTFRDLDSRVKDLILKEKNRSIIENIYREAEISRVIGGETCVWAAKSKGLKFYEEDVEEITEEMEKAITPEQRIEAYEEYLESFDQLEHGIVDAHPRQTLFNQTVSTMAGWIDNDLKPADEYGTPIIEPMLANMLYAHIALIDPILVKNHFIKLIEAHVARETPHWGWITAWLDKYSIIRKVLTIDDYIYLVGIGKGFYDISYFLQWKEITGIIEETPREKRKEMIAKFGLKSMDVLKWTIKIEIDIDTIYRHFREITESKQSDRILGDFGEYENWKNWKNTQLELILDDLNVERLEFYAVDLLDSYEIEFAKSEKEALKAKHIREKTIESIVLLNESEWDWEDEGENSWYFENIFKLEDFMTESAIKQFKKEYIIGDWTIKDIIEEIYNDEFGRYTAYSGKLDYVVWVKLDIIKELLLPYILGLEEVIADIEIDINHNKEDLQELKDLAAKELKKDSEDSEAWYELERLRNMINIKKAEIEDLETEINKKVEFYSNITRKIDNLSIPYMWLT